eukprot:5288521-Amphidinium_carterae.1
MTCAAYRLLQATLRLLHIGETCLETAEYVFGWCPTSGLPAGDAEVPRAGNRKSTADVRGACKRGLPRGCPRTQLLPCLHHSLHRILGTKSVQHLFHPNCGTLARSLTQEDM